MTTLGHSSIGNGTPLLGMICFAIAHRSGLEADQRHQRLASSDGVLR